MGALIAAAREPRAERRLQALLGVAGAALVALGFYTAGRPSIYASSSFWTSSPTWFAIRLGILMIALTVIYGVRGRVRRSERATRTGLDPLARMGRSSLFIYWIHVELVYGYASWLWRHRLPLWGTAIAFTLFCVLMYRAIGWRDAIVGKWRNRPNRTRHARQPATA